ncbi:hypothetical protein L3X38_016856 [Prunus dulcis]|uniref:Uncharacterized protein n=1 Tax=Prunus dulcis TaxID=3755 RepID=A0AAD4Z987_PRUDU|nr:hypothetical protein L3X38_016856 [Prunus dulcis]
MKTMLFVNGGQRGAIESNGYCNSSLSPYPMSCFKLPLATCKEINDDLRSIGKLGAIRGARFLIHMYPKLIGQVNSDDCRRRHAEAALGQGYSQGPTAEGGPIFYF